MENRKNPLIIVLIVVIAILCFVIGWLIESKISDTESKVLDDTNTEATTENKDNKEDEIQSNNSISKYVGIYKGEKGTDTITIKEDGTYEFILAATDEYGTENRASNGLVISNGVYLALVEFYDSYAGGEDSIAPLLKSYHFYINGSNLEFFGSNGTTDSTIFIKNN